MSDMRLSWMRDEEGMIAIYATYENGRKFAVADFWTGPMRQHMGISREAAKAIQQQLAETLVENWNGPGKGAAPAPLARAEAAEAEVERLRAICRDVPEALNSAFAAGTEECEGGSARRQEKALAPVDDMRRRIRAALNQETPND